jgi:hypothetical protein
MSSLNPDALTVTSFETTTPSTTIQPVTEGDNCISPLCMTEDKACTTPWCKEADTVAVEVAG